MQSDTKIRVGIVRGMAGDHYESSLKNGGDIISHLMENLADKYKPVDIFVDKDYIWHCGGLPVAPSDLAHKIDVAWNVSHPSLSNILTSLSIPNIRTSSFLSVLQNNRDFLKAHLKEIGLNMPRHIVLSVYQKDFSAQGRSASGGDGSISEYAVKKAKEVFQKFGSPWIVRSFTPEPDMGVHLAKTFSQLVSAIEDGLVHETSILVEESILGKVSAVHSVSGFRGEDIYTFPPMNVFGEFSVSEKEKLISLAKVLHKHMGAKHYLKSIFVLHPRGRVYLLSIDSAPNLKPNSTFHQVCESVGAKAHHVVDHILERALS